MIDAEKLVEFLAFRKITANQYLLCHLLYLGKHELLKKYVADKNLQFEAQEVSDLISKGYLEKLFDDNSQFSYMVTDKFARHLFVDDEEAGQEIWDTYPKILKIDGVIQSTRSCDKDDVLQTYYNRIKGSKEKHQFVMQMLHRYVDLVKSHQMNSMGIEKWIKGENWDVVAEAISESRTYADKSDLI